MSSTLRIGTRSSELALRQAHQVAALLAARGVATELVTYTTIGDRILDRPLAAIGEKGLFTAELEADLLAGRTDCAVHSLKDLPTTDPEGLTLVALLEREDPRDALVTAPGVTARTLAELPSITSKPHWQSLRAVKAGRVFVSDGNAFFNRSGPRLIDSLEQLAHALHPQVHPLPSGVPAAHALPAG